MLKMEKYYHNVGKYYNDCEKIYINFDRLLDILEEKCNDYELNSLLSLYEEE